MNTIQARRIPEGYTVAADLPALGVLVVVGGTSAKAWSGKRAKPDFFYRFGDESRRDAYITEWIEKKRQEAEQKARRRAERSANPHSLKVGDVLRSTWGYEQTNQDFYEVVGLHGKTMVSIRPIAQERKETGFMTGDCVPLPGQYTGPATRHRVGDGNSVRIEAYANAYRIEPKIINGVKIWPVSSWSSYA